MVDKAAVLLLSNRSPSPEDGERFFGSPKRNCKFFAHFAAPIPMLDLPT